MGAATLILNSREARSTACQWALKAPPDTRVTFRRAKRSIPQNDRMWAMLTDVSRQAEHNGNRYSPEQWKDLFMHACGHEVRFMAGLNGEPFPAGFRSSRLDKEQMGQLMDFIEAWAADKGIKWSDRE